MTRSVFALSFVGFLPACIGMPAPPPAPEDLSALATRYDHPTAVIPVEFVQRVIDEGRKKAEFIELLNRFKFVRSAMEEANSGLAERTNATDLDLQGSVSATLPCPGDDPKPTTDGAINGVVKMQFGVRDSRLLRGFEGAAAHCRLYVASPNTPEQRVVVSGDLVGDLGADVGIGNTLPDDILVKLTNVTGSATGALGTVNLSESEYHFRLTRDDGVEVLFDPAALGLPDVGTVVFVARMDGSLGVRESRGEWTCGGRGEACTLAR